MVINGPVEPEFYFSIKIFPKNLDVKDQFKINVIFQYLFLRL